MLAFPCFCFCLPVQSMGGGGVNYDEDSMTKIPFCSISFSFFLFF